MNLSDGPAWPTGRPPVPADRLARRREARRRTVRRRRLAAVCMIAAVLVGALAAVIASGAGSARPSAAGPAPSAPAVAAAARTTTTAPATSTAPAPARKPAHLGPSPGSLPQTDWHPSASSATFREHMAALWQGVVAGSVRPALPAFFPRGAYVQLKAIGSPGSDWSNRLVHDYALDIYAAHALLGAGARHARLLGVHVVREYDHWVPPGVCYNSAGYWETPNARVIYREGGQVRSFGIASMISWRGQWYPVHLGAVLRGGEGGVVDSPSSGSGSSEPSGTC